MPLNVNFVSEVKDGKSANPLKMLRFPSSLGHAHSLKLCLLASPSSSRSVQVFHKSPSLYKDSFLLLVKLLKPIEGKTPLVGGVDEGVPMFVELGLREAGFEPWLLSVELSRLSESELRLAEGMFMR